MTGRGQYPAGHAAPAGWAEKAFGVSALVILSGAFFPLLPGYGTENGPSSRAKVVLLLVVYVLGLAGLVIRGPAALRITARGIAPVALVALAVTSAAWSVAPSTTLQRAAALGGSTVLALYLATRFPGTALARLVGMALGITAVGSLAAAAFLPDAVLSVHDQLGAWRGVFVEKNTLGRAMTLGAATFVVLALEQTRRGGWLWTMAGLCAGLVVLSRSATSMLVLTLLLAAIVLARLFQARSRARIPVLVVLLSAGLAGVLLAGGDATALFGSLGKDTTLTGRVELWGSLVGMMGQRLWLGYGYGGFWRVTSQSEEVYATNGWEAWHAHNGLLDLGLSLGVAGVVLFVASFCVAVHRSVRAFRLDGEPTGAVWALVFLTFLAAANLTESSILEHGNLLWVLFVATLAVPLFGVLPPTPLTAQGPAPVGRLSPGIARLQRRGALVGGG